MEIRTRSGSYEVRIGTFQQAMDALPSTAIIVTDFNVLEAWGHLFPAGVPVLKIRAGESSKNLATYERILRDLAQMGADRGTTVVAVGGGVVGDLAGFVAATYMRGVRLFQIPTTLLAMVDSSVGGKVGVDLPSGKNMVGAFYPPDGVIVPIDGLDTLPQRHFANGMAEVWKYAYIMDRELGERLEAMGPAPKGEDLAEIVSRCICLKAEVVEKDEYDREGARAILNFGHTVAHALETETGFGPLLHGEAVAIGMVTEALLGEKLGMTPVGLSEQLRADLAASGLPTTHELLRETPRMLAAMRRDKKNEAGALSFSLLTGYGSCRLVSGVPETDVEYALMES